MNTRTANRAALGICAAAALLTGCGPTIGAPGAMPQNRTVATHNGNRGSWMLPEAKNRKRLLYLTNAAPNAIVYDYDTFEKVGTLTGLNNPEEECVDAKGDVWIVEDIDSDQGPGDAVEYARGGTTMLNEVTAGGPPIGCSVSPNGDLEITDGLTVTSSGGTLPGEVQIWKNGSGSPENVSAIANCYYLTSGGYDDKGNLYVTGLAQDEDSVGICELSAGGKALVPVKLSKPVTDPAGIMWDGRHMAITDDSGGSHYTTTIFQADSGSRKTLRIVGQTTLTDSCFGDEVDILPPPFIVGKRNTPVNNTEGSSIAGFNFICGVNPSHFRAWAYPAGGSPLREIAIPSGTGEAVSIAP